MVLINIFNLFVSAPTNEEFILIKANLQFKCLDGSEKKIQSMLNYCRFHRHETLLKITAKKKTRRCFAKIRSEELLAINKHHKRTKYEINYIFLWQRASMLIELGKVADYFLLRYLKMISYSFLSYSRKSIVINWVEFSL